MEAMEAKQKLVRIINNNSELVVMNGIAEEGVGIYEENAEPREFYPAGLDANGNIWACVVNDENHIYADSESGKLDTNKWLFGQNYKHLLN